MQIEEINGINWYIKTEKKKCIKCVERQAFNVKPMGLEIELMVMEQFQKNHIT